MKNSTLSMKNLYLIFYNVFSLLCWYYIWINFITFLIQGLDSDLLHFWNHFPGKTLRFIQTLAILEIIHSILKIVKSPVLTVFLQVISRIVVLFVYTSIEKNCYSHWSFMLMTGSWASIEIVRYFYYTLNLLPLFSGKNMPYILFWLRYTLFIILYPTGITGEILQVYISLKTNYKSNDPVSLLIRYAPVVLYTFGGPFMIHNMWINRKSQFSKRFKETKIQ